MPGDALAGGLRIEGTADAYDPPNPDAYPHAVDGRCRFRGAIGGVRVEGLTDFKRGAPWAKRRVIRGVGDGRPFEIEASYLEGKKGLRIDGVDQPCDPSASSYESVLATIADWGRRYDRADADGRALPEPRVRPADLSALGRPLEELPRPGGARLPGRRGPGVVGRRIRRGAARPPR